MLRSILLCCSASAESGSPSGWMDYFGQAIRTSVHYLPTQVSEVLTQSRDYAVAKLPVSGVKNVCAIATYVWLCIVICSLDPWQNCESLWFNPRLLHYFTLVIVTIYDLRFCEVLQLFPYI